MVTKPIDIVVANPSILLLRLPILQLSKKGQLALNLPSYHEKQTPHSTLLLQFSPSQIAGQLSQAVLILFSPHLF